MLVHTQRRQHLYIRAVTDQHTYSPNVVKYGLYVHLIRSLHPIESLSGIQQLSTASSMQNG